MTLNLKIAGKNYSINLNEALDQSDVDILGVVFDNEQDAKNTWGMLVDDWDTQIKNTEIKNRTKAVWLVVANNMGWWMSKEFLMATGKEVDAKLVREQPYHMPYVEFISKCSKQVRLECQNYLAKMLEARVKHQDKKEQVVTEQQPNTNRLFATGKKNDAVNFMLDELKADGTGTYVIKAGWLVNFIQAPVKEQTAQNLVMEVQENTLFVSFKREFYMNNREGCQKALEVVKTSCRGTKLEYGKMVAGRLPIKIRGTWKASEI